MSLILVHQKSARSPLPDHNSLYLYFRSSSSCWHFSSNVKINKSTIYSTFEICILEWASYDDGLYSMGNIIVEDFRGKDDSSIISGIYINFFQAMKGGHDERRLRLATYGRWGPCLFWCQILNISTELLSSQILRLFKYDSVVFSLKLEVFLALFLPYTHLIIFNFLSLSTMVIRLTSSTLFLR